MLWNLLQQKQISDLESSARQARRGMEETSQMQRSLDALCLTSAAMWELLSERLGVSDDELLAKVQEIDLRDGIQEQVVMALPSKPLCDEKCKGLCPMCGADRNQRDCGCKRESITSQFAVLKTLKLKKKHT